MTWLNSHTGKQIYPLELTPDMVTLEDVAHGLAGTMRYRAQTFLSVAQHSVAVLAVVERILAENRVRITPHDARRVLFHDASEYITCDLPAPIKHEPPFAGLVDLEHQVEHVIFQAFNIVPEIVDPAVIGALKHADLLVRVVERRFFRSVHPDWKDADAVPKAVSGILNQIYLAEWPPMKAKRIFMEAAKKVMG